VYQLNSNTSKIGLGITLKVMAGDRIDVLGKSYYYQNTSGTSGNSSIPIIDIFTGLLGGATGFGATNVHGGVTPSQINPGSSNVNLNNFFNTQTSQSNSVPNNPRAFINVLFFDEQFNVVDYKVSMVGNNRELKSHFQDLQNLIAKKSGFVYIYCSNESPTNVFFDNVQVVHSRSPLLETNEYYAFGLKMDGISYKAAGEISNKNKFGNKELQSNEIDDGSGLEVYDFGARQYDYQIGKWTSVDPMSGERISFSPYNAMRNNPISNYDPSGALDDWVETPDGEMQYDSRVIDPSTAKTYYGEDAIYRPVGYTYTAGNDQIELGDYGFFKCNGIIKISPDLAVNGIKKLESDLSSAQASLLLAISVEEAQALDAVVPDPTDLVPWKWVGHAVVFLGATWLIDKYTNEIADLLEKLGGPQGVQYALKATTPGKYPIMSFGSSTSTGEMYLNAGDVWKYGETINPTTRYSETFKNGVGVYQEDQFWGNQIQIKVAEKTRIYSYFVTHGFLPPGNKVFR
jgi:RHS repeat-associated protein